MQRAETHKASYEKSAQVANGQHNTMISLTKKALKEAIRINRENEEYRGLSLRVYIAGKGCDGFYYGVSFDLKSQEDLLFKQDALDIIIDPNSLTFMKNAVIDYVEDERGTGFLVDNPDHRKFRGKFYKKKKWKASLSENTKISTSSQ